MMSGFAAIKSKVLRLMSSGITFSNIRKPFLQNSKTWVSVSVGSQLYFFNGNHLCR